MVARDYQIECHHAIRAAYSRGLRRVLCELATGSGKTIIFSMSADMARKKGGRTLILCNRDNLVKQAAEKYRKVTGDWPSVEKAEEKGSRSANVVIASIQTLQDGERNKRLSGWAKDHFTVVITDEVHGAAAKQFRNVLTHFSEAFHVGFSATIERADGQGVGWFYEEICFVRGIYDLIEAGWLVPLEFQKIPVTVTLDQKTATKKHLTEAEEEFALAPYVVRLVEVLGEMIRDSKSLVFFPKCDASQAASQLLRGIGLDAKHVDSTYMADWDKDDVLRWFSTVPQGCLTNAQLLTTGYDQPDINTIAILRLIKSTPLWTQIVGRGTRPIANVDSFNTAEARKQAIAESAKPLCRVLDLLIQGDAHNIAQPSCLISTLKSEQDAVAKAAGNFQKPISLNGMKAALDQVKIDANEALRKVAEAAANAAERTRHKFNGPFVGHIVKTVAKPGWKPASPAQLNYLSKLGYHGECPSGYHASRIIDAYKNHNAKAMA